MTAILSIKMPDPKFSSQTKDKLVSSEIRNIVESIVGEKVTVWFDQNPSIIKSVLDKALQAALARDLARKARDSVRRVRWNYLVYQENWQCQISAMQGTELFIVEGDSAGGSAKQGRKENSKQYYHLEAKF